MTKKGIIILEAILLAGLLFMPFANFCLAGTSTPSNTSGTDKYGLSDVKQSGLVTEKPSVVIGNIIQAILGIVGVILVIVFIYGGVLYMTSGGNEQKVETAKKALTYGIVGIIIIALAFAVTRYVIDALF